MGFVQFMLSIAGRLLRVVAGAVIIWLALARLVVSGCGDGLDSDSRGGF